MVREGSDQCICLGLITICCSVLELDEDSRAGTHLYPQILTRLSQPALANCLMGCCGCCGCPGVELLDVGVMREPGITAGAQETAFAPIEWAVKMSACHVLSSCEYGENKIEEEGIKTNF